MDIQHTVTSNREYLDKLHLTISVTLASLGWSRDTLELPSSTPSSPPPTNSSNKKRRAAKRADKQQQPPPEADYSNYPLIVSLAPLAHDNNTNSNSNNNGTDDSASSVAPTRITLATVCCGFNTNVVI
jgi:hypothetical protein